MRPPLGPRLEVEADLGERRPACVGRGVGGVGRGVGGGSVAGVAAAVAVCRGRAALAEVASGRQVEEVIGALCAGADRDEADDGRGASEDTHLRDRTRGRGAAHQA